VKHENTTRRYTPGSGIHLIYNSQMIPLSIASTSLAYIIYFQNLIPAKKYGVNLKMQVKLNLSGLGEKCF